MNDANKHWLSKEDILQLRDYCRKHQIVWNAPREQILFQGSNGRIPDASYGLYKKVLLRILYEIGRRQKGRPIKVPAIFSDLPKRYYL